MLEHGSRDDDVVSLDPQLRVLDAPEGDIELHAMDARQFESCLAEDRVVVDRCAREATLGADHLEPAQPSSDLEDSGVRTHGMKARHLLEDRVKGRLELAKGRRRPTRHVLVAGAKTAYARGLILR